MDVGFVKCSGTSQVHLMPSVSQGLRTAFVRSGERRFSGYVVDSADPIRRFTVEILVDGYPVRVIRADAFVDELVRQQIGDGCYGFSCSLHDTAVRDNAVVEARLANIGIAVGIPVALARPSGKVPQISSSGTLRWLGGLRFSGWIAGREGSAMVNVDVDGTLLTRVRASAWSHVRTSDEDARAVRVFDFHLPERFADGSIHQVALIDDAGQEIGGGSLVFIAYPNGLQEAIAGRGVSEQERLRAELFDRLLPMSVPFTKYQDWRERYQIVAGQSAALRAAVIMVGPGSREDTIETLCEQSHADWVAASLGRTSEPTGLHTQLARVFLDNDGADSDFVVFAPAGTLFAPSALERIAAAFAGFKNAQAVYSDLDIQSDD
jgi:hypothetical protein